METNELKDALRLLNDTAYLAARIARKSQHPMSAELKALALQTDQLFEATS
jgi:hypothetical protein